jgi:hypothetical protein
MAFDTRPTSGAERVQGDRLPYGGEPTDVPFWLKPSHQEQRFRRLHIIT